MKFAPILVWYLASSIIGWCCFPLIRRIFPSLPDRGFAFSRALGLLLWGILSWFLTSIFGLPNERWLQALVLAILVGMSFWFGFREGLDQIWRWLRRHWRLVLCVELVTLFSFLTFTFFRARSAEIVGTEKPMELAFLNAILRSETWPPYDPWLSGETISYY